MAPAGMFTVQKTARRLNRSVEQVRCYLREGKLQGERIGQQWFVPEETINGRQQNDRQQQRRELFEQIKQEREAIAKRLGYRFDIEKLIDEAREGLP